MVSEKDHSKRKVFDYGSIRMWACLVLGKKYLKNSRNDE